MKGFDSPIFQHRKIKSVNPPRDAIGAVKIFPWLVLIFLQIQFLDNLSYAECSSLDDEDRCLNWNEIREMKKDDMEFGSHGCSYTPFGRIELKFLKTELESSKHIIESELGYECKYFALPF